MSRAKIIYLAKILLLFVIYFVTARFGLSLQAVSRFATLVWIPTGFSLAILLLLGFRYWPAIFFGAFFVNLFTGAPPPAAVGIAIGNTLEAVFGVFILRTFFGFINAMSRLKDVLSLVLVAAPLACAISATFGVTSLLFGGIIDPLHYFETWISWWVGDVISVFIVTPFILLWSQGVSSYKKTSRLIEFAALIIIAIAVGIFIFNGSTRLSIDNPSIIYLVYPPIIWAALRFGQREVASIMLLFSALAIWNTMLGFGPFAARNVNLSLLFLQFFMIITSLTSLILAVVVSERRRIEERKDDFISMASHELRTPVTSLKLYSQIVKTKLAEKKILSAKKYIGKLDDQILKLTALVLELLDISRVQTGKIQVKKEPFDINLLITDTVESVQRSTDNHIVQVKGSIKREIIGDKERIYQVLVNLLTNAIKYSPDGGKVIVRCKNMNNHVQVSVEDSGIGIDKNQLQRIFEKLYQVPKPQNDTVMPGLGIGLYISSEIIKMHKGKIWAQRNKKRKGTTFYFTLPTVSA